MPVCQQWLLQTVTEKLEGDDLCAELPLKTEDSCLKKIKMDSEWATL